MRIHESEFSVTGFSIYTGLPAFSAISVNASSKASAFSSIVGAQADAVKVLFLIHRQHTGLRLDQLQIKAVARAAQNTAFGQDAKVLTSWQGLKAE